MFQMDYIASYNPCNISWIILHEDQCSHLVIIESLLMPSFIPVLSHWTDGVSDGLSCMIMTRPFILCYGCHCSYTDFCDMY